MKLVWRILYRFYRMGSGARYWVSRRFTAAGLTVLGGLMVSSLMGPDTENNVAYQGFTFLLCLLLAAMLLSAFYRGRFSASRLAPRFGTVGCPLSYRVLVKNLGSRPKPDLLCSNRKTPRPSFSGTPGWRRIVG
jgi:peptidoglycan/LPS O-acetylase OafA/YrhL